jgi:hypothetical protein
LLHEFHDREGVPRRTWLERSGAHLSLLEESADGAIDAMALPPGSVAAVVGRYARPLDQSWIEIPDAGGLPLPQGGRLVRVRFRPRYDVIAKDYLVFVSEGCEPVAELATTLSAAFLHLARAAAGRNVPR